MIINITHSCASELHKRLRLVGGTEKCLISPSAYLVAYSSLQLGLRRLAARRSASQDGPG